MTEAQSCLHSSAQSDASPCYKLLIRENWWNVTGHTRTKKSSRWNGRFPRVLWDNFSSQGYLVLRTWWQHQDGEKAGIRQGQETYSEPRLWSDAFWLLFDILTPALVGALHEYLHTCFIMGCISSEFSVDELVMNTMHVHQKYYHYTGATDLISHCTWLIASILFSSIAALIRFK